MKKYYFIFIILIFAFSTTSCKGTKREIEKLAVVMASGVDITSAGKYIFTIQVLNPQKESLGSMGAGSSGGQQILSEVMIYSAIGNSPVDAINHLSIILGKSLIFGHSKYVVVGKDLAQSGLYLLMDILHRIYNIRPDKPVFVTRGKASDIISAKTNEDKIPADVIDNLSKIQSIAGYAPVVSRLDFVDALSSKSAAPILGVIDLNKNNHIDGAFTMAGTAVFRKDKLAGFMDINETRGMQWIMGRVKSGGITVSLKNNGIITFDIITSQSKIKPVIKNNNITMLVTIKETGNIIEMSDTLDPMKNPKIMDDLSKLQDKAIEKEAKLALNAAQNKFRADIFDFGGIIYRNNPVFWKKIENDWENIFPNIKVKIKVISSLKRPGIISKPIR